MHHKCHKFKINSIATMDAASATTDANAATETVDELQELLGVAATETVDELQELLGVVRSL